MRKLLLLLCLPLSSILACKTLDSTRSAPSASYRKLLIPDSQIADLKFDFCAGKSDFSAVNALWLSYLAIGQYTHFGILGPRLEELGFGDRGEGEAFRKYWLSLRIKRVSENRLDQDDSWTDEKTRQERLLSLKDEYKKIYSKEYIDDGQSATELEKQIVGNSPKAKIRFLSGGQLVDGKFVKGSTQVLYAEHPSKNFTAISFRGTEFDENPDLAADVYLNFKPFPSMGSVHSGFYSAYLEVEDKIISLLEERNATAPHPINLFISGHSLGGALANLLSARIALMHKDGKLGSIHLKANYTLGSPRVGNGSFADGLDALSQEQSFGLYRIRNHRDSITAIPPSYGYQESYWHAGALIYISKNGKMYFGNGFEEIEKNSDYMKSYPIDPRDHDTGAYFAATKRLFLENKGKSISKCDLTAEDKPLTPFYENPYSRQKNQIMPAK